MYITAQELEKQYANGISGLIFDCDGVMFDTWDCNVTYYNLILERLDLGPMTPEQEEFVHMSTVAQALDYIVPKEKQAEVEAARDSVNYFTEIMPQMKPEPGFFELLETLQEYNIRMAVHTNRTTTMERVLDSFSLSHFFHPVMTAGNVTAKPNPEGSYKVLEAWNVTADKVAFIGDSPTDMNTAQNAQLPFWAYKNENLTANLHVSDFWQLRRELLAFLGVKA